MQQDRQDKQKNRIGRIASRQDWQDRKIETKAKLREKIKENILSNLSFLSCLSCREAILPILFFCLSCTSWRNFYANLCEHE
jgi:hypothetical protein